MESGRQDPTFDSNLKSSNSHSPELPWEYLETRATTLHGPRVSFGLHSHSHTVTIGLAVVNKLVDVMAADGSWSIRQHRHLKREKVHLMDFTSNLTIEVVHGPRMAVKRSVCPSKRQ
jgi:hypothetical protein